ncbi:sortase [Aneurinibacillus sp. REN35]|uniref:sortase n=1 Tax=Aneurinibacillus sp. REN35 TaxID=3237286 RepID=UPI003526E39C
MGKRTVVLSISAVTLVLSLCVGVFSVLQILSSTWMTERALQQWEKKQTHAQFSGSDIIQEQKTQGSTARPRIVFPEGEVIGKIVIPTLHQEMPIVEGTSMGDLAKGVGHFKESVMPGARGNAVLAGHRDGVFRQLGEVGIGDEVSVQTLDGTYVYKVKSRRIVEEDDRSLTLRENDSVLTLITCYPFSYVGPAPKRLILSASLSTKKE